MPKKKEIWVDSVKIYACILVVFGHFFQSMYSSSVFAGKIVFVDWFVNTIYLFHVPIFFVCSGYLYQKNSNNNSFVEHNYFVFNKFITLGIPYFFFSIITWVIKNLFSASVNTLTNGFLYSLFLRPLSPYWYLYALFFIFLITPIIKTKKNLFIIIFSSIFLKVLSFYLRSSSLYSVYIVLSNHIWFVLGMCICNFRLVDIFKTLKISKFFLALVFLLFSVFIFNYNVQNEIVLFIAGVIGCLASLLFFIQYSNNYYVFRFTDLCSKFTLPVYLMHTIFAAGIRIVLLKIGINSVLVHSICGVTISFLGPIIASIIISKFRFTEFLLYPGKYIRLKRKAGVIQCPKN